MQDPSSGVSNTRIFIDVISDCSTDCSKKEYYLNIKHIVLIEKSKHENCVLFTTTVPPNHIHTNYVKNENKYKVCDYYNNAYYESIIAQLNKRVKKDL